MGETMICEKAGGAVLEQRVCKLEAAGNGAGTVDFPKKDIRWNRTLVEGENPRIDKRDLSLLTAHRQSTKLLNVVKRLAYPWADST